MENFHIFIASCYEGLDTQLPRLIQNLISVNIPLQFVHVIVGGFPNENKFYRHGVEIITVTYRCFEFTPHIYIANNPDTFHFDYAFLTHDTVKFGKKFYNTIQQDIVRLKQSSKDTMKIEHVQPSMNIGLYSKRILVEHQQELSKLVIHSNDKDELMKLKHKLVRYEDFILNKNNYVTQDASINHVHQFVGINGQISNGQLRMFERIDLIKYQSNANTIQSIDICKIPIV
jgi:hypothetical protein